MIKLLNNNVLLAARNRISFIFDNIERPYISFSGGKDSTVLTHLVLEEAKRRNRVVGLLIIDLEAQYKDTIALIGDIYNEYKEYIDLHWVCAELRLRNATSVYEPIWHCWDENKKDLWVRSKPELASDLLQYDFYIPGMEFEEFMVLFGIWYAKKSKSCAFVGIRADESLNRYKTVATIKKSNTLNGTAWTTKISKNYYNAYPIYDWKVSDIWKYHGLYPEKKYNKIYDKMQKAGVPLKEQRLCQPYGDTQRRGLWLYSILEADTWSKLINRVIGANFYSLYSQEKGNINGENKVNKPENMSWQEYSIFLLRSLPIKITKQYIKKIKLFFGGWHKRGYDIIPDSVDWDVERLHFAPSWRRVARTILRNDYLCKGLGFSQPKSEAYGKYLLLKKRKKGRLK